LGVARASAGASGGDIWKRQRHLRGFHAGLHRADGKIVALSHQQGFSCQ
jgi:hypothetical protein